jgi:hypothetical protein
MTLYPVSDAAAVDAWYHGQQPHNGPVLAAHPWRAHEPTHSNATWSATLAISPTGVTYTTVSELALGKVASASDMTFAFALPKGWFYKLTLNTAALVSANWW